MSHLSRLEEIALRYPEAVRHDIEAWDGEPTFRVRGKNFIFASPEGTSLTVKLSKEEAEAVVASDERASATGYGLGRHGWISVALGDDDLDDDQWTEVEEWIDTSYRLVAPKRLVAQLDG